MDINGRQFNRWALLNRGAPNPTPQRRSDNFVDLGVSDPNQMAYGLGAIDPRSLDRVRNGTWIGRQISDYPVLYQHSDGEYYALPTVQNGARVSEQDAIAAFQRGMVRPVGRFRDRQSAEQLLAQPRVYVEHGRIFTGADNQQPAAPRLGAPSQWGGMGGIFGLKRRQTP